MGHRRPARGDRSHCSAATCAAAAPTIIRPLFVGTLVTTSHDGRLRPDAISSMLERRCAKLGIQPSSAHQFRRAMAINAKARGMNDTTVQHIGRWKDPRMVTRYQRAAQAELSEAEYRAADPTSRQDPLAPPQSGQVIARRNSVRRSTASPATSPASRHSSCRWSAG